MIITPFQDPAREVLQATAGRWFNWLLISSAVVALGVALEAPEATVALSRWMKQRGGKEAAETNETSWTIPVSYLGLLLVIAGVIGEGIFESRVSGADTALQRHDLGMLAEAQKSAGDAEIRAGELELRAATLEEEILEVGPRSFLLYGKREQALLNGLRQFDGQKVQVRICLFNDKEVRDTAERLTAIFEMAKWQVSEGSPDWGESNCLFPPDSSPIEAGIWVGMASSTPSPVTQGRARKLLELLKAVPLFSKLHKVRSETVRSGSVTPNQMQYASPDSIVVSVLPHASPLPSADLLSVK